MMSRMRTTELLAKIEDSITRAAVEQVCRLADTAGGRAMIVGGFVRDGLLGIDASDCDIEVYGVAPERLLTLLEECFRIDQTGRAFGVLKLHGLQVDVSIPRRESKAGLGHKGFLINSDPDMEPAEAACRRDFTINSISYDPLVDELVDPFDGEKDLREGILRHTSTRFSEDPLRVLRGMQFLARFDLKPAEETVALCRRIEPEGLSPERIFDEWCKLMLLGKHPSKGLKFLRDTGWVSHFPELEALIGCEQDQKWHPEGDVWEHTLQCLDAFAAERTGDSWEDLVVGFAVLCHDLGKPATTEFIRGHIRSLGHTEAGAEPTLAFLHRMTLQKALPEEVVPLVVAHLRPHELYKTEVGDSAIRRLAHKVKRIDRLVRVARADHQGRKPMPFDGFPAGEWLTKRAGELDVRDKMPVPLVMGRHLIQLGLEPGPDFKPLLTACLEAQIDGEFALLEEGIEFARRLVYR
jgi:tRNA nucleotidyltransferase (CCA-adding enzyme)